MWGNDLTLIDTIVYNNFADYGGGIYGMATVI